MPSHSLSLIPCFSFTLPVRFSSPHLISSHRKTFLILPSHPLDPFIWFSVKCLIVFLLWKWKFFLQFTQTDNRYLNSQNWLVPLSSQTFSQDCHEDSHNCSYFDDIDLTFGTLAWRDNILFPQLRRWSVCLIDFLLLLVERDAIPVIFLVCCHFKLKVDLFPSIVSILSLSLTLFRPSRL